MGEIAPVARKLGRRAETAAERKDREQKETELRKRRLELGERIRYLRKDILGYGRQQDFADRLGVTRGAVGNWEIGTGVKPTTLELISEVFNVSYVWLSKGTGAPFIKSGIDAQLELLPPEEYETLYSLFQAMIDDRKRKVEESKRAKAETKQKK